MENDTLIICSIQTSGYSSISFFYLECLIQYCKRNKYFSLKDYLYIKEKGKAWA